MDSAVVIVQSHSSASWCVQKKPLLVLIVESRGFFGSANNASCLDNAFVSLHLRIPPRVLHFSALVIECTTYRLDAGWEVLRNSI